MTNAEINLDLNIAKIPDFPKPGITFYDIGPILEAPNLLKHTIDSLCHKAKSFEPDLIGGLDARGFLFATPIAYNLNCGSVMIRKSNKLPGEVITENYDLEYDSAELSIQKDRNLSGKRVLLMDDLIATGGSLNAAQSLVNKAGGSVCGALCLIELTGLKGRDKLDCPVDALQSYLY